MVIGEKRLRLAVLQRVCAGYRVGLFAQMAARPDIEMCLFIGEDVPNSKVKNAERMDRIPIRKLKTRFIRLGGRILPWHMGLVRELKQFDPDVILCEGESHFLGYLQALYYRWRFNRPVGLIHWCYISLPGWKTVGGSGMRAAVKALFRRFFDAFVLYSAYSKECLLKLGQPSEKAFVATNVCDVEKLVDVSDGLRESRHEARRSIGIPERFTVLYLGTLDNVKRPDVMLELARQCDRVRYNFVLVGGGPLQEELRDTASREGLENVFLPGRVTVGLPLYWRAADVLVIPGRGGIVISEAMAFGLPVIVHQADGTEYDLVINGESGVLLSGGLVSDFRRAIEFLENNPCECARMGVKAQALVRNHFTTERMATQIVQAAVFARNTRDVRGAFRDRRAQPGEIYRS